MKQRLATLAVVVTALLAAFLEVALATSAVADELRPKLILPSTVVATVTAGRVERYKCLDDRACRLRCTTQAGASLAVFEHLHRLDLLVEARDAQDRERVHLGLEWDEEGSERVGTVTGMQNPVCTLVELTHVQTLPVEKGETRTPQDEFDVIFEVAPGR